MKQRVLKIAHGSEPAIARLCERLRASPGVQDVIVVSPCLRVDYELRRISLAHIEAMAEEEGVRFRAGLHAIARDFWKYLECNELANAAAPANGACCNRPPGRIR